ncbi:uncharacterized protein [Blastocystis hominis]|uniref:RING-type domain-containing protein n=1 Tax=Blastocystis hominis TaxID=12968 RepID=D8MAK7_BLAHO|nr:uncharacterized protein [Blastocystis hominis]CBK25096.2 unnamed protein product [Blastocystis hominis]|eukprot:XP_012899144.1 uncharacterized protein [Blastocystis hominis]
MSFTPHCNICFIPIDSPRSLFTSCGHFICPTCSSKKMSPNSDICPHCGQSCSTLFVDENMPDEVQQYITSNPIELFTQAVEIYKFQENHNRLYFEYLQRQLEDQKKEYEAQLIALKQENERLKRSNLPPSTPRSAPFQPSGFSTVKRPDFISRFKPNFTSMPSSLPKTPLRPSSSIAASLGGGGGTAATIGGADANAGSNPVLISRPSTPSFTEKKLTNPFSKASETYRTPSRQSSSRKGLDIPGSIMRHPQLTNTPARSVSNPPFQLIRPSKTAPAFQ